MREIQGEPSMRRLVIAASLVLIATGAVAQPKAGTSTMQLDTDHAVVTVTLGGAKGRFALVAGAMQYDPVKPEESTIALSLDTTSLDADAARTAFDSRNFPEMRIITMAPGKPASGGTALPTNVTVREITRPVVLHVSFKSPSSQVIALHAEGTLKSGDYKLGGKGGDIALVIDAPFIRVSPTTPLP
jgi:polyisoprenoid-binding protein YceI